MATVANPASAPVPDPELDEFLRIGQELIRELEKVPLVESDGEPLDSPWHRDNISLLIDSTLHHFADRDDFYVGGNMFIYFSLEQARNRDVKGPDYFFVKGRPLHPQRRFWVTWEEDGRLPNTIIELTSPSTEQVDRVDKFALYEQTFRTPDYFCYDPFKQQLDGWRLGTSGRYEPLRPNDRGWLWSEELGLWLGAWDGAFNRAQATWLRFYDAQGQLVPTLAEAEHQRALAERQRAETERQRAEAERRRADAAEAELAALRAQLHGKGNGNGAPGPTA